MLLYRHHNTGEVPALQGLKCNYLGDVSEMLHLLTEVTQTKPKGLS